jgi:hypothetical protein
MHEESPNGGAKWWLAGAKQRCVLTLAEGKEMGKGKNLWPTSPFIGEGERGRGERGPARRCQTADGLPVWWERGPAPTPLSW